MPPTIVWSWPWLGFSLSRPGLPPRRLVADRLPVTDPDRVARVEADDLMVPDVHAGDAVAGRRHDEGLVEADLQWARSDRAVPVDGRAPRPRCHLPTIPVARPARFSIAGSVSRPGSMMSAASPGRTLVPFRRQAYSPVSRE